VSRPPSRREPGRAPVTPGQAATARAATARAATAGAATERVATERAANSAATRRAAPTRIAEPLVWSFDGSLARCLADLEDTLRRVLVQLGDVGSVVVRVDVSLPALKQRVQAGDALQPSWSAFMGRLTHRYGLPAAPRVHPTRATGPLFVLVVAYRS